MITMSGVSKLIGNTWVDEADAVFIPSGISDDFKDSLKSMADSIIEYNKRVDNQQTANYKQRVNGDWIDDREELKNRYEILLHNHIQEIERLKEEIKVLTTDNEEFADGLIEQEETIEKLKAEIALLKKGTK